MTREIYQHWKQAGGFVQCAGKTQAGRRCRNPALGGGPVEPLGGVVDPPVFAELLGGFYGRGGCGRGRGMDKPARVSTHAAWGAVISISIAFFMANWDRSDAYLVGFFDGAAVIGALVGAAIASYRNSRRARKDRPSAH